MLDGMSKNVQNVGLGRLSVWNFGISANVARLILQSADEHQESK